MISKHTGEIVKKEIINDKYILLDIKSKDKLQYKSGQYISLFIKDKIQKSFSIYSSNNSNILSLGIKIYPNGIASNAILSEYNIKDKIDFLGPVGNFYYRDDNAEKIIFIATGIGIIPIKGILDELILNSIRKDYYLFWGTREEDDLIFDFKINKIKYYPIISGSSNNKYKQGYVQNYINNVPSIDINTSFYICGSPENVDSIKYFIKDEFNNINFNKIYTEKF